MATPKLTAAYVRVSTKEQSTDAQRKQILEYCGRNNLTIDRWYEDKLSGNQVSLKQRDLMLSDVEAGKIGTVVAVAVDRFTRDTPLRAAMTVQRIYDAGADLKVVTQDIITSMPADFRPVLLTIITTFAHQEVMAIRRRVQAGMDKAKANGVRLGRPRDRTTDHKLGKALAFVAEGMSLTKAAAKANLPLTTLRRHYRASQKESTQVPASAPSTQSTADIPAV